jgi:hypothetical protein
LEITVILLQGLLLHRCLSGTRAIIAIDHSAASRV